jgi:serine/threonine protein kinase
MNRAKFSFLNTQIPLPFCFTAILPFNAEDKLAMPWLAERNRCYGIDKELKKGGRAIAFKGHVKNVDGVKISDAPSIVLKVPNIDPQQYTSSQIREFLNGLSDEGGREWQLTRKRLYGCEFANPIFDFDIFQIPYLGELMKLPITAQLYLHDAVPLDDYLLRTNQRTEPYLSRKGVPYDNWNGMPDPNQWIQLARAIAIGLADIHQRRVVHGDIWPPNIFIKLRDRQPMPIFIDFGEAFPIEPQGTPKEQRDHAYRAPERRDRQSIVTQQSDVYSLGKLLLHLAIGEEPILASSITGHNRTELIRQKILKRNQGMIAENPFILNIICKCVSVDPVDRPRVSDVVRALTTYVDTRSYKRTDISITNKLTALRQAWQKTNSLLTTKRTAPFLEELVVQRLDEIDALIKGLSGEVVTLTDTRERIIVAMIGLFRRLQKGDRFLSVTSPRMWQGSCLGLDGRYFSASEMAITREASIQRTFVFSIQELGEKWSEDFAKKLSAFGKTSKNRHAVDLASALQFELKKFVAAREQGEASDLPTPVQQEARLRLQLVMRTYAHTSRGTCKEFFKPIDKFVSSAICKGVYVGLLPVSTLASLQALKAAHPVAVFYYGNENVGDQYLLMMTDCLARNSSENHDRAVGASLLTELPKPEIKGLTVFKSVLGIPEDRIKKIEQIFKQSISVAHWVGDLEKIIETIPGERS